MPKPFLMLTSRDDEVVAADELEALPRIGGLAPDEVVRVRLEREPFPDIDPADWSGVILCGSPFDAGAPEDAKSPLQRDIEAHLASFFDLALDRGIPYLGVCYGLGTLTRHLGGTLDTDHAEEISGPELRLTPAGHDDLLLQGVPDVFHGYVGHHEAASGIAPGATLLVTTEATPVQMVRVGERAWATQFHPELDLAGILVRINEYADRGYYPPSERSRIEEGVRSVDVSPAHLVLSNFVREFRRS
ncbi:glutamine amidotransferase [Actinomyces sp.]|uniref:glutamine amidotransferase n=1 Tax=Actinomyces sp. TaxID=29317 RepID=UPI0028970690|nr:glutamine amidotransferase [Actinomyces sp.]